METSALKFPTKVLLSNILVRLLSFCVLVFLARFAYVVTVKTHSCDSLDFCFFPNSVKSTAISSDHRRAYYLSVFQDLVTEGVLSANSNSLCIEAALGGEEVAALREIGVSELVRVSSKKLTSEGLQFRNSSFDFEFSSAAGLDRTAKPIQFASEVSRTLKPGGFFVVHTESFVDEYSLRSLLRLFGNFTLVKLREIDGLDSLAIREIILRKQNVTVNHVKRGVYIKGKTANSCAVPRYKRELIRNAEPLIQEEPLKPWITLKRNIKNVKYLSGMVDISFKNRYIYVDVGARSYGSSIVSWFKKQYPKQDKPFEVYAVEADSAFHNEYKTKKGVTMLPYAAWIRNETLFFEISREPSKKNVDKGRGMGRIQSAQSSSSFMDVNRIEGFDFALWLKRVVTEMDYVVVKMDVEGTEFDLIPRLISTGAICSIDEMFLECHYNRWQKCCPGERSPKYQKTYAQCLELFSSLRKRGVLVHQWW
ncbi:methyltransferase [Perilla frutescens var. hirtella]|uniref:Methyltransferase n=1 Tax=Perilla frutescens var. hirtella TaxID=608512 RepID=A0AAD4JNG0_PERFH|nr:methyltransferase [Perilla frutescens var. hirtella]